MKIKKAYTSSDDSELSILNSLCQKTEVHDGAAYVISMLKWFVILGPGGKHLCLVFEVLGPSVSAILEWTPEYRISTPRGVRGSRFPLPMAKRILRQILLGISYLHSNRIIHGDMHCGNLLLVPPNLHLANTDDSANMDNWAADKAEGPVTRLDIKIDLSAPRYVATATSPLSKANRGSNPIVQISDLGSGEPSARLGVIDKMNLTIA